MVTYEVIIVALLHKPYKNLSRKASYMRHHRSPTPTIQRPLSRGSFHRHCRSHISQDLQSLSHKTAYGGIIIAILSKLYKILLCKVACGYLVASVSNINQYIGFWVKLRRYLLHLQFFHFSRKYRPLSENVNRILIF